MSWHIHDDDSVFDSDGYGSEEEEYEQPESRWDVEADNDEDYCRSFEREDI